MKFTYNCNQCTASIEIELEPIDKQGSYYRELVTKDFKSFLNRYYRPDISSKIPCISWSFVILESNQKIGFHVEMDCSNIPNNIHKLAEELYEVAQRQITQAIDDYTKVLTILKMNAA